MSYSQDVLGKQDLELIPGDWKGDELTVRLWALLSLDDFIMRIGWIEHTNDWDLFYEVTVDGETIFSKDVTPLNSKGKPYTMENGVNDHIVAIRVEEWNNTEGDYFEGSTEIPLSKIDRIFYG